MRPVLRAYRDAYTGLPLAVWLLSAVALVNRSGAMVVPFLSLYLTAALGLDATGVGLFFAAWGVGSIAGTQAGGWLTDRVGPVAVQVGSLLAAGAGFFVLKELQAEAAVAATLFALALVSEAFRPANAACLAALVPAELRPRAFALNRLAINVGCAIAPAVGGLLAEIDYGLLFLVDGATCVVAGVMLLACAGRLRGEAAAAAEESDDVSPWSDRVFLVALVCTGLLAAMFIQALSTLPLYFRDVYGFREGVIGLVLALNPVIIVVAEMVLVRKIEHRPPLPLISLGALLYGVAFGLLPLGVGVGWAVLVTVVWTIGEMLESPMMATFVASRAGPRHRGRYMGLYMMAFAVAQAVAHPLALLVYGTLGPEYLWFGCLGIGIVVSFVVSRLARSVARETRT